MLSNKNNIIAILIIIIKYGVCYLLQYFQGLLQAMNEQLNHRLDLMESKLSMLSDRIDNVELQLADITATNLSDSVTDSNRLTNTTFYMGGRII